MFFYSMVCLGSDLTSNARFDKLRAESSADPEGFWGKEAEKANWFQKWSKAFEWTPPTFRWFPGGTTNLSYNCLDLNIRNGNGDKAALIGVNELGERRSFAYSELLKRVLVIASALRAHGVHKGDRVAIYMPTMPEAIIAMLAINRIGAIHIVVFAGFGSAALGERAKLAGAKVLLTTNYTLRRGKKVDLMQIVRDVLSDPASPIEKVVLLKRENSTVEDVQDDRIIFWSDFLAHGDGGDSKHVEMEANEPAFILATSGTTAKPKLVVHVHGGYQVWLRSTGDWLYRLRRNEVWWSTSDIGWIVGHSYIVYAPLLFGSSTIAYEGALDFPGPDTFYRIIEKEKVAGIFTAPTAVRLLMNYGVDAARRFDLSSVERIFCAGEVLNPPAWAWLQKDVFGDRVPVIDHMWQTETGGPIICNPYGLGLLPIKPGSATLPLPGVSLEIRGLDGSRCGTDEKGIAVLTMPFPGLTPTLWGEPNRYKRDYWERIPGVYFTGDAAYVDSDGYLWFSGRADEIIKIAGHRIGTIEVESALLHHPAVAEAGVTGRPDQLRGEVISAFVVLRTESDRSVKMKQELLATVREQLGPVVVIGDINFVSMLPKTRSGKIIRRVLKAVTLGKDPGDISTIEDEGSVAEARQAWKAMTEEIDQQQPSHS
jgi:acetyl-CoA synthetase